MCDKFLCGVLLGMLGGALLVTNSVKARTLIKEGQAEVEKVAKKKMDEMSKLKNN